MSDETTAGEATATEPIPFQRGVPIVDRPITAQLQQGAGNSSSPTLTRSYWEDDAITDTTYTTTMMLGDIKCFVREFTAAELKAYRGQARLAAIDMGLDGSLVDDAEAFVKALTAVKPDAEGRSGMDQYSHRMAGTFNEVVDEHLRGWELPKELGNRPCTRENKLKLWPSVKFEFCANLQQLGGLSAEDTNTLKN